MGGRLIANTPPCLKLNVRGTFEKASSGCSKLLRLLNRSVSPHDILSISVNLFLFVVCQTSNLFLSVILLFVMDRRLHRFILCPTPTLHFLGLGCFPTHICTYMSVIYNIFFNYRPEGKVMFSEVSCLSLPV